MSKVAIITGGLTGMGLASAVALSKAGHKIALGSRRGKQDKVLCDQAKEAVGGPLLIEALDVCDQASIDRFLQTVSNELGPPTLPSNQSRPQRLTPGAMGSREACTCASVGTRERLRTGRSPISWLAIERNNVSNDLTS